MNRHDIIEILKKDTFDLLIIGGGITGAGIALDASLRGLKTALVEMNDFASGTSSKSTKLIHGGLRYLEQLNFKLVVESGREREIAHKNAPHLCIPQKMMLPIIPGGSLGLLTTSMALSVYDTLAGVKWNERKRMLSVKEARSIEPILNEIDLRSAGFYTEYRTDDARLTIEIVKAAAKEGCTVLNYAQVQEFNAFENNLSVVSVEDNIDRANFKIKSKKIVSATGPWVDKLRKLDSANAVNKLKLSKGIHLVFSKDRVPVNNPIYIDTLDDRMIFIIPRGNTCYVGTTDTEYTAELQNVEVDSNDVNYIIDCLNHRFPSLNLSEKDILSSWAGLRPLIYKKGKSTSDLSRKDEIFISENGLISIAGGKLTGYRKMAERVVDLVCSDSAFRGETFNNCETSSYRIAHPSFNSFEEVKDYITSLKTKFNNDELIASHIEYLVYNYGLNTDDILNSLEHKTSSLEKELIIGELEYCLKFEFVERAIDFFMRRTGRLYFDINSVKEFKKIVIERMSQILNWNTKRIELEFQLIDEAIDNSTKFH